MNCVDMFVDIDAILVHNASNCAAWYSTATVIVVLPQTFIRPKGLL